MTKGKMKELGVEFLDKAKSQTFKRSEVNGVDVIVWITRHLGFVLVLAPIVVFFSTIVWKVYMKPQVREVAMELDKPIIARIDTLVHHEIDNNSRDKKVYYLVKKMELVQRRHILK